MYETITQIPGNYTLITDSQDIESLLDLIGYQGDYNDYGLLFVEFSNTDIKSVYASTHSVPYLYASLDHIYQQGELLCHLKE